MNKYVKLLRKGKKYFRRITGRIAAEAKQA
jgi:hypothetical protein